MLERIGVAPGVLLIRGNHHAYGTGFFRSRQARGTSRPSESSDRSEDSQAVGQGLAYVRSLELDGDACRFAPATT